MFECMCARASVMWVFKSCFLQVVSTKYISAYKYYYRNLYSVYVAYLIGVLLSPQDFERKGYYCKEFTWYYHVAFDFKWLVLKKKFCLLMKVSLSVLSRRLHSDTVCLESFMGLLCEFFCDLCCLTQYMIVLGCPCYSSQKYGCFGWVFLSHIYSWSQHSRFLLNG